MKNNFLIKLLCFCNTLLCITLFSCEKSDVENAFEQNEVAEKLPISISSNILTSNVLTRSANNQFEENDQLGFYVLADDNKIVDDRSYNNEPLKYRYGTLVFDNDLFYPFDATKCSFISYYPYSTEGFPLNKDSIKIAVDIDQTSSINYKKSDFLLAIKNDILPTKDNVQLDFHHMLSKIDFVITSVTGIDPNSLVNKLSINIDNIFSEAVYELTNQSFCKYSQLNSISLNGDLKVDVDNNRIVGKSMIAIPQNTTECYIVVLYNNTRYRCNFPKDLNLKSGDRYAVNISFDPRVGITQITSNIIDWNFDDKEYDVNLEEKDSDKIINIAQLDFAESSVIQVKEKNSGEFLGELCYEYLLNDDLNEAAIVYYSAANPLKGTLLRRLNNKSVLVGDIIEWHNNSFSLTKSEKHVVTYLSVNQQGELLTNINTNSPDIKCTSYIIKDIRGNENIEYPIVKIGQQYWMRENLRATNYNDGGNISAGVSSSSSHNEFYFMNENNIYYNIAAVNSDKIAPIGWSIPNDTQWDILKNYVGNVSAKLKSFEWGAIDGVSNITGFNAKPIGVYTHSSCYQINFIGELFAIWKKNSSPLMLKDTAILFTSKNDDIVNAKVLEYCAYSVRAVKNRN